MCVLCYDTSQWRHKAQICVFLPHKAKIRVGVCVCVDVGLYVCRPMHACIMFPVGVCGCVGVCVYL